MYFYLQYRYVNQRKQEKINREREEAEKREAGRPTGQVFVEDAQGNDSGDEFVSPPRRVRLEEQQLAPSSTSCQQENDPFLSSAALPPILETQMCRFEGNSQDSQLFDFNEEEIQ